MQRFDLNNMIFKLLLFCQYHKTEIQWLSWALWFLSKAPYYHFLGYIVDILRFLAQ